MYLLYTLSFKSPYETHIKTHNTSNTFIILEFNSRNYLYMMFNITLYVRNCFVNLGLGSPSPKTIISLLLCKVTF